MYRKENEIVAGIFFLLILTSLLLLPAAGALALSSEGVPLEMDVYLEWSPRSAEELPDEVTFALYDSEDAVTPLGLQTFPRGDYSVDFEFSKSDGIVSGSVARITAGFTNALNLEDAETDDLWLEVQIHGQPIGNRERLGKERMVQLLLRNVPSASAYLSLVDEQDNILSAVTLDGLPFLLPSDFMQAGLESLSYEGGTAKALGDPNNWYPSGNNIRYTYGNVGVGTMSPSAIGAGITAMDVEGPNGGGIWVEDTGGVRGLYYAAGGLFRFGSFNNYPITFVTNNARRITVDTSGRVGIGTTSPAYKLQVDGSMKVGPPDTWSSGESKGINFGDGNYVYVGEKNADDVLTLKASKFYFENGNVGIGTSLPQQKLHVNGISQFSVGGGSISMSTPGGWPGIIAYSPLGKRRDIHFYDSKMTITTSNSSAAPLNDNGITIDNDGRVGIGTTTPNMGLDVQSGGGIQANRLRIGSYDNEISETFTNGNASLYLNLRGYQGAISQFRDLYIGNGKGDLVVFVDGSSRNVGIGTINPNVALDVIGNIEYTGTITDVSDERLKENVRPIDGALEKIQAIDGVYFNMVDTPDEREIGVIAQKVNSVFPEAVRVVDEENQYLGVSYVSLVPALIEAIKELKSVNDSQQVVMAQHRSDIEELRNVIEGLRRRSD